jgi:threonyl-tRNA synthetase
VQALLLPITEKHHEYADRVASTLRARGIRVGVDSRSEKVGYKIREAQLKKIPFMLVVGDKETESATVAVRNRKKGDLGSKTVEDLGSELERLSREKSLAE